PGDGAHVRGRPSRHLLHVLPVWDHLLLLRLPLLQGRHVPVGPDVRLGHHLPAVPQGARAGHAAERGGQRGHRPGHRPAVRPGHHAGAERGPLHDGPAAGPAAGSGRAAARSAVLRAHHRLGAAGRAPGRRHALRRVTLQWQKLFTVLSTAVFGAAIMTVCVDYFVEMLALAAHVYECLRLTPGPPLCWYSWVILGIWPTLALVGVLVQWKLTDGGFSHTEVVISRRQKRVQLMRIREKEAKKRQQ
ncbi:unnamed protein product, partial [Tetraodon nigroviridis]